MSLDFIDLATSVNDLTRRLMVQNPDTAEDDDFAHLTGQGQSSHSSSGSPYYEPPAASDPAFAFGDPSSTPFLSKTSEAELYLLATNFLLYVAMVIITILVAKIYFPDSLDPDRGSGTAPAEVPPNRQYSYRRSMDEADDVHNGSASDEEIDKFYASDGEDDNDILDSGEEGAFLGSNADRKDQRRRSRPLEFDQDTASKTAVLKRLVFCSIMLNVTFVVWGALQERMLTRRYPRFTGDYFQYSYALVFTNRFWTLILSGLLLLYLKPKRSQTTVLYEYSFPSISNMLSSWCQYEALRYVSFPATTLFKSFKLAPVMAMGKLLGNKTYPQYDYMVALIIGFGITLFMSSTDDLSWGENYLGEHASTAWTGILLLFLFLFFDSFTSQFQSRMFQRHADLSMVELMFATSAFSTILSAITLVHTHELSAALAFVFRHSEIHLHFFLFSICSTIGQLLIFYTIKNFGAVVFTLIMTTRILLSIALSCVLYGHNVTGVGFLGLVMVLGAVLYRIRRKAQGQQLIKWQGMGDDKGPELVQEWHEHVDM